MNQKSVTDQYYTKGGDYPHEWSIDIIVATQIQLRTDVEYVANVVAGWGGRKPDAGMFDRARDKKQARGLAATTAYFKKEWAKLADVPPCEPKFTAEVGRQQAAVIDWDEFINEAYMPGLLTMAGQVVSWAIDGEDRRFANKAAWRFHSEIAQLKLITER